MSLQSALHFLAKYKYFGIRKFYWIVVRKTESLKQLLLDNQGLFPRAHQSIIKRNISRSIIQRFSGDEGQNINTTQFFLGFGLLHYSLVRNTRPKRILCVGSRKGYIPVLLALACKDNNYGQVDFVDAGFDESDTGKNWSGVGFWKKVDPQDHFGHLGVESFITTHVMTTAAYARKNARKKYQYIYIDGDHSYEGAKLDYSLFWPPLEKGGFMSFHDVVAKGKLDGGTFGVGKLWQEIGRTHKKQLLFPFPKDSGLGLIQK